jgi:hypothetical protein
MNRASVADAQALSPICGQKGPRADRPALMGGKAAVGSEPERSGRQFILGVAEFGLDLFKTGSHDHLFKTGSDDLVPES